MTTQQPPFMDKTPSEGTRTQGLLRFIIPVLALAAGFGLAQHFFHGTAPQPAPAPEKSNLQEPGLVAAPAGKPSAPPSEAPPGMVWVPGGTFRMGTDDPSSMPRERPAHQVQVDGFWVDATEVTNAEFREFVKATGYVTTAEKAPSWEELKDQVPPGTPPPPPEALVPGSMVFAPTNTAVPLNDYTQWWRFIPGANWMHPEGPESSIEGKDQHPVVQVSWDDAQAYARWADKRLPTEAEWEFAARGGLESKKYAWGEDLQPEGRWMANIWQGVFPVRNRADDGFVTTAPVKTFPPNGYGLYDTAGNVWEWCGDWYDENTFARRASSLVQNPRGPEKAYDPDAPYAPKRVVRGGSYLCTDSYCTAYRTTGRMASDPLTGLSHTGFRCVKTPPAH